MFNVYKLDVQRPAILHLALVELLLMCFLVHLTSQLYCYVHCIGSQLSKHIYACCFSSVCQVVEQQMHSHAFFWHAH